MMAIPKAFNLLGLITGSILMLVIACVTIFTLAGKVNTPLTKGQQLLSAVQNTQASRAARLLCWGTINLTHLINCVLLLLLALAGLISATAATGAGSSYGALVRRTIGPKAEAALQFAVLANCYIMEVVFVVVLGDILVGTAPEYGGLLPEWMGASPAHCFWLRRDVVLGAVSLLVLLPLAAMRSMERLAVVNIIGVCVCVCARAPVGVLS